MTSYRQLLGFLLLAVASCVHADPASTLATIDLASREGAAAVHGDWRYSDTRIVTTRFAAPGADGQPGERSVDTYDVEPHAGRAEFDDSAWPLISPESLGQRRGQGRLSFNWYRLHLTVPESIAGIQTRGTQLELAVRLDDYAEVWVDGELARPYGAGGAQIVAGWNAVNRVILTRNARPGQSIVVAIFGMNGPISDTPRNYIYVREARLEVSSGSAEPVAVTPQEVNVEVRRVDPAIDAIVPVNAKLYKLAEGFQFTEGPVWSRARNALLFSDPNANRIYEYGANGALSVFREHSGYDASDIADYGQPGSNGLTFDREGRLLVNEHGRHRVSRLEPDDRLSVLVDHYQGRRLNSPNDLVTRSDGSIYFTDPPFGLPKFYADPRKELPYSGVYRWNRGRLQLLTTALKGPNGIAFSPDEKYLYVDNWDAARKVVLRFPVARDGSLGAGEVFIDMTAEVPGEEALDGMKVDENGTLYVAAPDGIRLYDARGRHLGTVRTPHPAHNFAWGDADGRTLYITARGTLYRLPLLVTGRRP